MDWFWILKNVKENQALIQELQSLGGSWENIKGRANKKNIQDEINRIKQINQSIQQTKAMLNNPNFKNNQQVLNAAKETLRQLEARKKGGFSQGGGRGAIDINRLTAASQPQEQTSVPLPEPQTPKEVPLPEVESVPLPKSPKPQKPQQERKAPWWQRLVEGTFNPQRARMPPQNRQIVPAGQSKRIVPAGQNPPVPKPNQTTPVPKPAAEPAPKGNQELGPTKEETQEEKSKLSKVKTQLESLLQSAKSRNQKDRVDAVQDRLKQVEDRLASFN